MNPSSPSDNKTVEDSKSNLRVALWSALRTDERADTYVIPTRVMELISEVANDFYLQLILDVIGKDENMGGKYHTWYCSSDRNSEQSGCICPESKRAELRTELRKQFTALLGKKEYDE